MTTPLEWEELVAELELQGLAVRTSEGAKMLKSKVEEAIARAESNSAPPGSNRSLGLAYVGPHGVVKRKCLH